MKISVFQRGLFVAVSLTSLVVGGLVQGSLSASAIPLPVTASVNTTACPAGSIGLINGSFEDFSNPAITSGVTSNSVVGGTYRTGRWHGYATGPDQILYLDPTVSGNSVTGWRSTSSTNLIELQRQVNSYTSSQDQYLVPAYSGAARSGVTSVANIAAGGSYWDLYAPQPASGSYWAELNAVENAALYQDITIPAGTTVFWSLKHRGRTDTTQEQMIVQIGPTSGSLVTQTGWKKYTPTGGVFSGNPTYAATPDVSQPNVIADKLSDGWGKYEGVYSSGGSSQSLRFQFQTTNYYSGWQTFGNLLDDLQFTPFAACPITRNINVGQTETIDVTGSRSQGSTELITYGLGHSLQTIGNPTAPASEFSTSGNSVSFTPTQTGTFSVDYQMVMNFGGQPYTVASRITYNVAASPIATYDPAGGTVSTTTETIPLGSSLGVLTRPTPVRPGYTFTGWFTAPTGGTEVTNGYATSTYPTADLTLYARWTAIPVAPTSSASTSSLANTGMSQEHLIFNYLELFGGLSLLAIGTAFTSLGFKRTKRRSTEL